MKNILVNWKDLKRGDIIKYRGRKHLVIGFSPSCRLSKTAIPIIYSYRMLFGKYKVGKCRKIFVGDYTTWFEVIN